MKWTRHLLASDFIWFIAAGISFLVIRQSGTTILPPLGMGAFLWFFLWGQRLYLFQHKESPPEGWIYWLHMGMSRTGLLFSFSGAWAIASFLLLILILPPANGLSCLLLLFVGLYGAVTFLSWWDFGLPGLLVFFYVPIFSSFPLFLVSQWLQAHGFTVPIPGPITGLTGLSGLLALLAAWLYFRWLKKDLT